MSTFWSRCSFLFVLDFLPRNFVGNCTFFVVVANFSQFLVLAHVWVIWWKWSFSSHLHLAFWAFVALCYEANRWESLSFLSNRYYGQIYAIRILQATENMEWSTIYVAFFSLFYIVELLFMLCYFGNVLTTSLELVAESTYDSKWYTYPPNLQKDCAFMIRSAQKPFWISAFGIMPCTLENFSAVRKSSWFFFYRSTQIVVKSNAIWIGASYNKAL